MSRSDPDLPQKYSKIMQDDKFFARHWAGNTSVSYPSFNECGVLPGAVPFIWESQPGTPKNKMVPIASDTSHRSPLTPPPSQSGAPKNKNFPDISLRRTLTFPHSQAQPNSPKNTTSPDVSFRHPLPPPPSSQFRNPKNTNFPDVSLHSPLAPPPSYQSGTLKNTKFTNISFHPLNLPPSSQSVAQNNKIVSDAAHSRSLTPPPSSNFQPAGTSAAKAIKLKHSRSLLLDTLLDKIISLRKSLNIVSSSKSSASLSPSPSKSSLSSRSWSSSARFLAPSTTRKHREKRSWQWTPRSSFNGKAEDEEDSTVCFALACGSGARVKVLRCYGR